MAPFEELQTLWQSQNAPAMSRFDAAAAANAFRRYGRRQDLINTGKSVLLALAFVQAVVTYGRHPLMTFVTALMVCAGVLALVTEWRTQRAIANFNFAAPSVAFVRSTLTKLQRQRNPLHTREFAILFAAVFLGLHAIVISSYPRTSVNQRILGHAIGFVMPVLIYLAGRALRRRRWESECRPLVDRLQTLLQTLEEQPN